MERQGEEIYKKRSLGTKLTVGYTLYNSVSTF